MARTDSKWMPLYIGDYLADTSHLTRAQHGSYLLLLMAYWRRGGALPDDDTLLGQIAKCSAKEWQHDKQIIAEMFQVGCGLWKQARSDKELARASAKTKAKAEAGAKGAAKRWQTDSTAIEQPKANTYRTDAPLPSPSHSPDGEKSADADLARKRKRPIPPDWQLTLKDRQHAAAKGLDAQTIGAVAEQFRDHHTSKHTLSADWGASWRTWVGNHIGYHGTGTWPRPDGGKSGGNRPGPSSVLAAGAAVVSRMENQPGLRPDGSPDLEGDPADAGSTGDGAIGGTGGPVIDGTCDPERNSLAAHPPAHRNEDAA